MDAQNITLSVLQNVLVEIKHLAVEKETSVSQLMTETIINNNYLYNKAKKCNCSILFTEGLVNYKVYNGIRAINHFLKLSNNEILNFSI